jgi:hypothetical protein
MSHSLSKSTKRRRVLQEIDEILPSFDTVYRELEVEQLMHFNTLDPVDKDSELHSVDNNVDMSVVEERNQLLEGITQKYSYYYKQCSTWLGGRRGTEYPNLFSEIIASPYYHAVIIITFNTFWGRSFFLSNQSSLF